MLVKNVFIYCVLFIQGVLSYIETVTVSGCESCALRLTCRHLDSIIAILEANIDSLEEVQNNETFPTDISSSVHPRTALNHRCSGVNHCSFILTKDCPGAEKWKNGNLTIKYACIADRRITKFCNKEIILPLSGTPDGVSQGFVHNPGYPRFYLGKQECRWKIRAPALQKVKVTIVDIALIGDPNIDKCTDLLEVSDSGQTLYTTCEQEEPPIDVLSLGDTLDIVLRPSPTENLLPRRGVLFYYTAVGCPTPPPPKDGYLVRRNDTLAEFSCCVGYSFPDTRRRKRIVKCLGHQWGGLFPIPDCDNKLEAIEDSHLGAVSSKEFKPSHKIMADNTVQEIVIPSIIMVALFLLNFIVLFVIYKYRQRKVAEASEEELGTLPIQINKELTN